MLGSNIVKESAGQKFLLTTTINICLEHVLLLLLTWYICRAANSLRPSRWVARWWDLYFQAVVKELPRAFYLVFLPIIWNKKICILFFRAEAILFLTHIFLPVGNTPYRKSHNSWTISITPLQSMSEEGLHSQQHFLVWLTNQFDAFFNPRNALETNAYIHSNIFWYDWLINSTLSSTRETP